MTAALKSVVSPPDSIFEPLILNSAYLIDEVGYAIRVDFLQKKAFFPQL